MGWGDQWGDAAAAGDARVRVQQHRPEPHQHGVRHVPVPRWHLGATTAGTKTSDPWKQTQYGLRYIKDRYRDPHGGLELLAGPHTGTATARCSTGPQTIGVGEKGPEAVIPLNDRGADVPDQGDDGREARGIGMGSSPMRGGMSVYNTRIDKSTNFTGPITVQANDPNELMHKLQARQRVMALSRPSLTGSAA